MDNCFIDIIIEFLCIAFHNILYYSSIYPNSIFETRRKYSILVYSCIHPEVANYIEMCLKTVADCFKNGEISRIEFLLNDSEYRTLTKFIFDFNKTINFDETSDAYLVQCEQNMRAFLLSLSSVANRLKSLPEEATFSIQIHTTESTVVSLATNPDLEDFPMIEKNIKNENLESVIPLRQFSIRGYNLASYIEM